MCADIAITTNLRLGEDDAKLPDPGPQSDAGSLRLRQRVDLFLLHLLRGDRNEFITRAQIECPPSSQNMLLRQFGQTVAHQEVSAKRKT
jgi:hypothetical protein